MTSLLRRNFIDSSVVMTLADKQTNDTAMTSHRYDDVYDGIDFTHNKMSYRMFHTLQDYNDMSGSNDQYTSTSLSMVVEESARSNNYTVMSVSEYLRMVLGPRRQALVTAIPVTIFYGLIFVIGVIGNVTTCVIIAKRK